MTKTSISAVGSSWPATALVAVNINKGLSASRHRCRFAIRALSFPEGGIARWRCRVQGIDGKVVRAIETPGFTLDIPLDLRGTAFQQRVWQALREIPVGSVASYQDIARKIGMSKSAQDVAEACAANTLAIVIPCHRVIRSDGSLAGYRWGMKRKRALLQKEQEASPEPGSLFHAAN